ncbi:universal stress protein [Nocardioides sp. TF02-7]|uniref:universal stress protein n=1 Tax=Nocardioides sp. TF02-7 TaxID=2917724 RepID=UPI001F063373|nr:universal stress protein [Nocardioides sp. TF02-7]UMG92171.1 universal stress protein [Nocardioides sp. TF02-7]
MATVVVGYVPKPEGEAALAAAVGEAQRHDARLVVVHTPREGDGDQGYLDQLRATLAAAGVDHDLRIVPPGEGTTGDLVTVAEEVDATLIVIGLRRRSPVGKLILGSNAQRVLLDAPCPVLTVKPQAGGR